MIKLLLCMFVGFLTAVVMLQLRQQHLELEHQAMAVHSQIEARQAALWDQQLQIATQTSPSAVSRTSTDLHMTPRQPAPANPG
jgi:hypothetical protein